MIRTPLLAVTPGDPDGIGPEIVWKAIQAQHKKREAPNLLCVGARSAFDELKAPVTEVTLEEIHTGAQPPRRSGPFVWLVPAPTRSPKSSLGKRLFLPGYQAGWSIETATCLVKDGLTDALVTGPISKERLQKGGFLYPGHTEFLAELCGAGEVTMMLANDQLRISLVTTHIALKEVSRALTARKLERAILHTADHLRKWWGIKKPNIGIAALNPHAGEGGLFGQEEIKTIAPTIKKLSAAHRGLFTLSAPLAADTLFAKHTMAARAERFDAVVCMYHDQGLIPVKLLDFPQTVNVTLGLPIVRTSVDHGTGFDIAGKGIADPSSLQAAIRLAAEITRNRDH